MRRINALFMLLAMMAGGFWAYGQTSPQDTYYKFNQTYAAGATVAPDEGNGGDLTVGQAVIAKSPAAEYMQNTYSYGISTTVSANGTKVTRKMLTFHVAASTDNPAHILLICKDYKATSSAPDNYWGIFIASTNQWVTRQIIRPTHIDNDLYRMGCYEFVVNETNDYDLSAVGVQSSGKAEVYELRVIYEKNALYQSIRNSLAIEFNNSTTTADRATTSFFRLCQTRPFDEVNGVQTLGGGVYFRPYANGTIVVDLINNNDQTAGIALDSILVFTNVSSGIQNLHASTVDANTTVNDFTLPRKVYKGGEYRLGYNTGSYIKSVRFIPDHYTVTLDANGGTVNPAEFVYIKGGDPITAFPTPTKENYMFDGWDPAAPSSFPYTPTADITYTAQWTNPHGQCGDNLTWEYDPITTTLTITGTGDMYDYTSSTQPWKDYKNDITTVVLPDGLTKIGNFAFYQCNNASLTSIDIPSGVTSIGNSAFTNCSHLASVTIPDGVTYIQSSLFNGCTALTSVTIPSTVTNIDAQAFRGCTSLTSITLPEGLKIIDVQAFMGCTNLASVYIPSSVTVIYDQAFSGCSSLTDVIMPDGTSSLGFNNKTFYNCASLTSITLPSRVKIIQENSFNNCTNLADVYVSWETLPTKINANAFTNIASPATLHVLYGTSGLYTSAPWTNFNIVEMNPHGQCGTGVTWEYDPTTHTLTISGTGAMDDTTPWNVYKSAITALVIEDGVTAIGNGAFSGFTSLTDVTVHWTDLSGVTTDADAFDGLTLSGINLHIPDGTAALYHATAPWSSFHLDYTAQNYPITANGDPDNANIYYSTFYDGLTKYAVPENVEAYAASVNGSDLVLTKIADANEVLPAGTAVILKSTVDSYTMVPSDGTAVTITATNHLHGVDVDTDISSVVTSGSCYVLSYKSGYGVGFYLYQSPNQLKAHKAYINLDGSGAAQAPKHLRFVFTSTTGIEDVQGEDVQGEKFLRDGVLYIQRGEQLYNAQGMKVQ